MFNQTEIENKIKVYFKNKNLLTLAFVHKSYVNENSKNSLDSNERLEFLGDAVLELITTSFLFKKYPDKTEGELTPLRSCLVRGDNLATVSKKLDLGKYLFLSKGEFISKGQEKLYILANVLEALIGAIYLDQGYKVAEKFINTYILSEVDVLLESMHQIDSKSTLQELSQEKFNTTPEYKLISDDGPDHKKIYKMGAYIDNKLVGKGEGTSKQKAEQKAAFDALKTLKQ